MYLTTKIRRLVQLSGALLVQTICLTSLHCVAGSSIAPGHIVSWGQMNLPYCETGAPYSAIAAAGNNSVAINSEGLICWGGRSGITGQVIHGITNATSIAVNGSLGLALQSDGTAVPFGIGSNIVTDTAGFKGVAVGVNFAVGVKVTGELIQWGALPYGLTNVPAGNDFVMVAAGSEDAIALRSNGTVVAWGGNDYGATEVPPDLTNIVAVGAGETFSIAVPSNGVPMVWGSSGPVAPPSATNLIVVAGGATHCLGLRKDGSVVAWGGNYFGQATVPDGLSNVVAIAAGSYHSLALKQDGTLVGWGANNAEQTSTPEHWSGFLAIDSVSQTIGLKADGSVVMIGWHAYDRPVQPPPLTNVIAVVAGDLHFAALCGNGTVVSWGDNTYSQTNVPADLTNVTAISAGMDHTLALKADGTVVAWGAQTGGFPNTGQSQVPAGLDHVVAISAGVSHSLALKDNGTVVAWGNNTKGQLDVPPGLTSVKAISAGGEYGLFGHSLALLSNGTVVAWGDNVLGQTNVPVGLTNVIAISASKTESGSLSMAVKSDGTIVSWGSQGSGEATAMTEGKDVVTAVAAEQNIFAVRLPPQIANIGTTSNGCSLAFHSFAGKNYILERATVLSSNAWQAIPNGTLAGTGYDVVLKDIPGTNAFYRLRVEQ